MKFASSVASKRQNMVTDYLLAEVLADLPADLRARMLQISLLDRFCAPLYEAIWDETNRGMTGAKFLRTLRRSNFFLMPLDDEGVWYRFHHLFLYLLRHRLQELYTEETIRVIHARASAWLADHGLIDEAIRHVVQAGALVQAAALIEDRVHPALDREDWRQVEHWLELLPPDERNRPRLLVAQAWLHFVRYQYTSIATLVEAAEEAMADDPTLAPPQRTTLCGEIGVLKAAIAFTQNDVQSTVQLAQAALERVVPEMQYVMGLAHLFYINGIHAAGDYAAAVAHAHKHFEAAYARQAYPTAARPLPWRAAWICSKGQAKPLLRLPQNYPVLGPIRPRFFPLYYTANSWGIWL